MPVTLSFRPTGPKFSISADAVMPRITVTAVLSGVAVNTAQPPVYRFSATPWL